MTTEKFCLRWNDFERNLAMSLQELRGEEGLQDVTLLPAEGEPLLCHKLVLSACSPFFRSVLARNRHQHPLLYMKGTTKLDENGYLTILLFNTITFFSVHKH